MSSLSVIIHGEAHGDVQYRDNSDGYPRLFAKGSNSEVDTYVVTGDTFIYLYNDRISEETQYFYRDRSGNQSPIAFRGINQIFNFDDDTIVTVGNLLVLESSMKIENILHWYQTTIEDEPAPNVNGIVSLYFNILNNSLTIRLTQANGSHVDYILSSNTDTVDDSNPEYLNSLTYSITNALRSFINEINSSSSLNNLSWVDAIGNPFTAKELGLPNGIDDKIELIKENTATDYLCFNTIKLNSGIRTEGVPVGDPEYLYKDQEISSRQFFYNDSLGNQTPVQYQKTVERLVTETTKAVEPGSYIQLVIYFNAESSTVDYIDDEGLRSSCRFNGEDIFWGVRGTIGTEVTMIKIEDAIYQTSHFYIDVSEDRLILYPKEDYAEYCIQSAILTGVM